MKKIILLAVAVAAVFVLTACNSAADIETPDDVSAGVIDTATPFVPADDVYPDDGTQTVTYRNTNGNIANGGFVAQDGDNIYYVLPTNSDAEISLGSLIKTSADGGDNDILFSGDRPFCLNVADGWIYYISSLDSLIYRMREDGTENTLITSADTQDGFMQGYTSQNFTTVETMTIVDDYIYCRTRNIEGLKDIVGINITTGETARLQHLGTMTSGLTVHDGWIYYSIYMGDLWETHRVRTDGSDNAKIADFQIYCTNIVNDRIYYLNVNSDEIMSVFSMNLDGSDNMLIADGADAVKINVVDDWIYYTDTAAIYKIKKDGTETIKLCDFPSSQFIDINIAGDWIYISAKGLDMYKVKTDGSELILLR